MAHAGFDRRPDHALEAWASKGLEPHLTSITRLVGSSIPALPSAAAYQQAMADWQAFWMCLPNLQVLRWTIPSCAVHSRTQGQASTRGLPASLETVSLAIQWDAGTTSACTQDFHVSALEAHGFHSKTRRLTMEVPQGYEAHCNHLTYQRACVHLGHHEWPLLDSLDFDSLSLWGTLQAPNLTILKLDTGHEALSWSAFTGCRNLRHIHVTNHGQHGIFDCRGCSFPNTVEHLYLSVGRILEDGCFSDECSASLKRLLTLHVSFQLDGNMVDLQAARLIYTLGALSARQIPLIQQQQRFVSPNIEAGFFQLWMPQKQAVLDIDCADMQSARYARWT